MPEGAHVGQPIVLREWQRDIIRGIYDSPTRRAIVSFGRKNGKTSISAFLLLLHLCGPEARANSQLFSAAQSRDQAAILFSLAAKIVRMSPDLNAVVAVRDTAKQLYCQELGTLYRALSAEASTAYGLSPVFTVHDELGQVKGPRSELYQARKAERALRERESHRLGFEIINQRARIELFRGLRLPGCRQAPSEARNPPDERPAEEHVHHGDRVDSESHKSPQC